MKTTMSALAALALMAATDVRADETLGYPVRLAGSETAQVRLVYQHAVASVPGKSVKGGLVEYAPGGYSASHRHAKSAPIYATVIRNRADLVRKDAHGDRDFAAPGVEKASRRMMRIVRVSFRSLR